MTPIITQVAKLAGMDHIEDELFDHFKNNNMVLYILDLPCHDDGPSVSTASTLSTSVHTVDDLGKELVKCCAGLHLYDVEIIRLNTNDSFYTFKYYYRYGRS